MNVNDCNDYVLIALLSQFSFQQLFQRRRVCVRWKSLIETLLRHRKSVSFMTSHNKYSPEWHSINGYDVSDREYIRVDVNSQQLDYILSKCQNLLSLDFVHKTIDNSIIDVISNRCHHLNRLDLSFCVGLTSESVIQLSRHLTDLKELQLINTDISDTQLYLVLTHFKSLESLDVSDNFAIRGESLRNMSSSMKSLNVLQCKNITNKAIVSFISANISQLTKLFLGTYCETSFITDSVLKYLCLNISDLRELHCIYDVVLGNGLQFIQKFKRLQVLILTENKYENYNQVSIDDNSITLIMKECNQLKRIQITSVCGQTVLTDNSLCRMNEFCPLIERLHIESFFKISSKTLNSISQLSNLWYLQLINLDIDDTGIVNILQSCLHLRHFAISFTDKVFAFSHKITDTIVMTCIDVMNQRKSTDKMLFRVFGACLPSHRELCLPENLTLQIVGRERVRI